MSIRWLGRWSFGPRRRGEHLPRHREVQARRRHRCREEPRWRRWVALSRPWTVTLGLLGFQICSNWMDWLGFGLAAAAAAAAASIAALLEQILTIGPRTFGAASYLFYKVSLATHCGRRFVPAGHSIQDWGTVAPLACADKLVVDALDALDPGGSAMVNYLGVAADAVTADAAERCPDDPVATAAAAAVAAAAAAAAAAAIWRCSGVASPPARPSC